MLKLLVILGVAAKCLLVEGSEECIGTCLKIEGYSKVQYLRHNDCNKYCVCISNISQVYECNIGEHWSEDYELCTTPAEAKCKNRALTCIGKCPIKEDPTHVVLLAHEDCTKYCRCKNGQPIVKNCGPGLLFSPRDAICVPESESDCTGINGPGVIDDARDCMATCPAYPDLIAHKDCDKYCRCENGRATVENCRSGLWFSESLKKCVYPEESGCYVEAPTGSPATRPPATRPPPTRPPATRPPATRPPVVDDAISKGCQSQCPAGSVLIGHHDCDKYCRCENGWSTVEDCPAGLWFSERLRECVYPDESGCYVEAPKPPPTRPPATRPPATRPPATRPPATRPPATRPPATRPPATRPPVVDDAISKGCQSQCPAGFVLIGHHYCDKYCRCENGWSTVEDCPAGLWFSERLRECVYPDESDCYVEAPKPPPTRPPATRPPATRPPATRPPATRPPATRPPATRPPVVDDAISKGCQSQCPAGSVLIGHHYCDKYCRCENGWSTVEDCPAGLWFSERLRKCVYPDESDCYVDVPPRPPVHPPPGGDGKGCIGRCPLHNSLNYTVHLPHEECSKFCKCDWGKPYVFECPDHLHFNPIEEVCDYTFNVNCTGIGSVIDWLSHQNVASVGISMVNGEDLYTDFAIGDESEEEKEDQDDSSREEGSKIFDSIFIVGPHADVNGCIGKCPLHNSPDYTIFLAHEECRKFCKCDWGKPMVMECPDGLHFNPRENVCDFIFSANCTGIGGISEPDIVPVTDLIN